MEAASENEQRKRLSSPDSVGSDGEVRTHRSPTSKRLAPTMRALSSTEEDVEKVNLMESPCRSSTDKQNHFSVDSPDVQANAGSPKASLRRTRCPSPSKQSATRKLQELIKTSSKLDMQEVRQLTFVSLGEDERPAIWKLLLHYLPNNPEVWEEHLKRQREAYRKFIQDIIPLPKFGDELVDEEMHRIRLEVKEEGFVDHDDSMTSDTSKSRRNPMSSFGSLSSPQKMDRSKYKSLFGVDVGEDSDEEFANELKQATTQLAPQSTSSELFDSSSDSNDSTENDVYVSSPPNGQGMRTSPCTPEKSANNNSSHAANSSVSATQVISATSASCVSDTAAIHADDSGGLSRSTSEPERTKDAAKVDKTKDTSDRAGGTPISHLSRETVSTVFDPLSKDPENSWCSYFSDGNLRNEITKDVLRTHPTLHFFQKKAIHKILKRILFLFAKLNPGVGYVQGMNELLAPLVYVIANEPNVTLEDAESDSFYVFTALMAEMRDVFIRDNDRSSEGLAGVIHSLKTIIHTCEPEVATHLSSLGVEPDIYAFRWLTTLLAREFDLADTILLWDKFFADPHRFQFTLHCCVAMIRLQRQELLSGDFGDCLSLLQDYPPVDIDTLIQEAVNIRKEAKRKNAGEQRRTPDAVRSQEKRTQDAHRNDWNAAKSALTDALQNLKLKRNARAEVSSGRWDERRSSPFDHQEDVELPVQRVSKDRVVHPAKRAANLMSRAIDRTFKSREIPQDQELKEMSSRKSNDSSDEDVPLD